MADLGTHLLTSFRARLTAVPPALATAFSTHVDLTKLGVGSSAAHAIAAFGQALEATLIGPHATAASVGIRANAAMGVALTGFLRSTDTAVVSVADGEALATHFTRAFADAVRDTVAETFPGAVETLADPLRQRIDEFVSTPPIVQPSPGGGLTIETSGGGATTITYSYDADGNLSRRTTTENGSRTVSDYTYGPDGRLSRETTTWSDGETTKLNGSVLKHRRTRRAQSPLTAPEAWPNRTACICSS